MPLVLRVKKVDIVDDKPHVISIGDDVTVKVTKNTYGQIDMAIDCPKEMEITTSWKRKRKAD
ncbi:hypothetical protein [Celeribacter sp.]|uniref:hypothetical protein n=1 Tax=Celeribacter sp. TaxID=1890673 RepID=UPI003A8F8D99